MRLGGFTGTGKGPCDFVVTQEPADWRSVNFSDDAWQEATVFPDADVRPKGGYDQVDWHADAQLIWSADLKRDNTILFRVVIERPGK